MLFKKTMLGLAMSLLAASASADIVNINSLINGATNDAAGYNTPVSYTIGPGTYHFDVIGPSTPGATFTAWNAWGNTSGCNTSGACSNTGWLHYYSFDTGANTTAVTVGDSTLWATPQLALNHAQSYGSYTATFASTTTLRFFIADIHHPDNLGGVSLNITPVPEPETYAMMLAGLAGLGLMARRKKAIAPKK